MQLVQRQAGTVPELAAGTVAELLAGDGKDVGFVAVVSDDVVGFGSRVAFGDEVESSLAGGDELRSKGYWTEGVLEGAGVEAVVLHVDVYQRRGGGLG